MRHKSWMLLRLLLLVITLMMVHSTERHSRKLVDPQTELFEVEPEMLIFGSRSTNDAAVDVDVMAMPFAKIKSTNNRSPQGARVQLITNASEESDIADASTIPESVQLHQQRQPTHGIASNGRMDTPTQRRQKSSKRNRNESSGIDLSASPRAYRTYNQGNTIRASSKRKPAPTTPTTTTTTTTRGPNVNIFENFQRNNPFNFFSPEFWNPTTTVATKPLPRNGSATKRPPKKYQHATPTTTSHKDEKLYALQKPKTTATTTVTSPSSAVSNANRNEDGPFRITLPTLSLFGDGPSKSTDTPGDPNNAKEKEKRATIAALRERFVCPRESEVRFQLFPKICNTDRDCSVWQRDEICCDIFGAKSCVTGKPKPLEESSHAPILGVIPRKCPTRPLAELWWEVKECDTDMDCWPRICCPDGRRRYCRTSQPELEAAPVPVKRSFNYLTEYLECTPPPPPIFDLHPRACTSTLDCFPNVCCQEAGLRHCRPPKKSVLTLMANFLNVDFVKRLTQNIVIK